MLTATDYVDVPHITQLGMVFGHNALCPIYLLEAMWQKPMFCSAIALLKHSVVIYERNIVEDGIHTILDNAARLLPAV